MQRPHFLANNYCLNTNTVGADQMGNLVGQYRNCFS